MAEKDQNKWPKSITVDKRIVKILSESTYENFPRALKELITNSYDADARNVHIEINLAEETLIVEDDGKGMNDNDFSFYIRIAGKKREKEDNETALGRKIIGQFGVGFLSIFPFFKNYYIESKKTGTSTLLYANIPLYKYFSDENKAVDIDAISINGGKKEAPNKVNRSYTRIVLTGFNELTKAFFFSRKGDKAEKDSIKTWSGLEQLKWALSEDLPLPFRNEKFNKIFETDEETIPFNVFVNNSNEPLYRNAYGDEILETHKEDFKKIGKIKCKYFIATPKKIVKPIQGRYFKIRNLNVGVGDRSDFGIEHGERSHERWIYGEIHILDGLNNLIKVSRDGFNFSPDFEELQTFFHERLRHFSTKLENAASFQKDVKQTGKQFRVNNPKNLQPEKLKEKLESYKRDGYQIKKIESGGKNSKPIKIDQERKEIFIERSVAEFEKHIILNKKKYKVVADRWDYESELFPACKINGSTVVLNQNYPLFHSIKFTDIFFKIHLMLTFNFQNRKIDKRTFTLLSSEILEYCSDYQKK